MIIKKFFSTLCLLTFAFLIYGYSAEKEIQPVEKFLQKSGIWSGEFVNFVTREGGVIQRGKIRIKISVDNDGIISQRVALIRPDGTTTDYQGSATLKVTGNRLNWVGSVTKDESTENPIENHVFEGYVGWNHIYFVETYEEVFPDGRREKRSNNIHYVALDDGKLLQLADIRVDGVLLVFANTVLELQDE